MTREELKRQLSAAKKEARKAASKIETFRKRKNKAERLAQTWGYEMKQQQHSRDQATAKAARLQEQIKALPRKRRKHG
jgi:chromosome segregation ATPase